MTFPEGQDSAMQSEFIGYISQTSSGEDVIVNFGNESSGALRICLVGVVVMSILAPIDLFR